MGDRAKLVGLFASALVLAASGEAARSPAPPLRVEIRARALVAGEPLRVVVTSTPALQRVEGTFLERPLTFVADSALHEGTRWLAWSAIPLGRAAGTALLRVSARTSSGESVESSRTVEIHAKRFPKQDLQVDPRFVTPPADVEARIATERRRLAEIYGTATPRPTADRPFVAPVPGAPSSPFGAQRTFNGVPRDPHPGLDLKAASGTPVRAAGPGRVALAEDLYFSGGTVILDHGGGMFTVYAHLSRIDVHVGDDVPPDAIVGLSGATGRVTGPHLHWGAKVGEIVVDPRALLDPRLFR